MSAPPFVRFYANDWFTGCAGLKADERGVYVSICVYIWTTGNRVPLCDAEASRMMGLQFNNYQRLRDRLVVKEKVQKHADGYGVKRAEAELDLARNRIEAGATAGSGRRAHTTPPNDDNQGTAQPNPLRPHDGENAEANGALLGTPIGAPIGTPIGDVEKSEQNQQPSIDSESLSRKKEDNPLTPIGGGVSHFDALNAFEAYNARALVLGIPQASKLTPDRQRRISARLKEFGPDGWAKALTNLDTPFLRGLTAHRFRADLDFICQAKSFSKLHDGGYAPAEPAPGVTHASGWNSPPRALSIRERALAAIERGSALADAHFAGQSGRG